MTTIEKALELIFTFGSIKLALEAVKQIEDALLFGSDLVEIQNMDEKLGFWEKVRNEINKISFGL